MREWAAVMAKLQLSFGRIECVELRLVNRYPDPPKQARQWWATVFTTNGPDAMLRLKTIVAGVKDLVPYIKDWELFPPDLS